MVRRACILLLGASDELPHGQEEQSDEPTAKTDFPRWSSDQKSRFGDSSPIVLFAALVRHTGWHSAEEVVIGMILIWGWKSLFKTLAEGMFHCPNCDADRHYRHRSARKWFTLFWIPVIPLKQLGTFIECDTCQSRYEERVLTLPTSEQIADNLSIAVRGLVVAIVTADGLVDPAEREHALNVIADSVHSGYTAEMFDADLEAFAGHSVDEVLAELAGTLNDHGKEHLLSTCIELAMVDGHIDERELDIARRAGAALSMTPSHTKGIISDALERAAR